MQYGYRHSQMRQGGADYESQGLTGSRYKGPGSTDNDMPSAFDESSWTPYTIIEGAIILGRIAWTFLAIWQLCRHSLFPAGTWVALLSTQFGLSGAVFVATALAFWRNYEERKNNIKKDASGRPVKDTNGLFVYADESKNHKLPEIRNGLLYTFVMLGADVAIWYFVYEFWHADIAHSDTAGGIDAVDQRRLDRNMWLIIIVQTFASTEAVSYFFNFLVYAVRRMAGPWAQLMFDL